MQLRKQLQCSSQQVSEGVFVEASVRFEGQEIQLEWLLRGPGLNQIVWPSARGFELRDELWKHSCFEAFFKVKNEDRYYEFNICPALGWNVYHFDAYRQGMLSALDATHSLLHDFKIEEGQISCRVTLRKPALGEEYDAVNLSTVLHIQDRLTFWAPSHPAAQPDFHESSVWLPLKA